MSPWKFVIKPLLEADCNKVVTNTTKTQRHEETLNKLPHFKDAPPRLTKPFFCLRRSRNQSIIGSTTGENEETLTSNPNGDADNPVLARNDVTGRLYFSTLQFAGPGLQVFRSGR